MNRYSMRRFPYAQALLACALTLLVAGAASAMTYSDSCKQNGGAATCRPVTKNSPWVWGPVTGGICPSPTTLETAPVTVSSSLGEAYTSALQAENALLAAVDATCDTRGVRYSPASCSATATYWDPPSGTAPAPAGNPRPPNEHAEIRTCACGAYYGAGLPVAFNLFTVKHPYCAPSDDTFLPSLSNGPGPDVSGLCVAGAASEYYCLRWEDPKNLGNPACISSSGNPVNTATGNKYQVETDFIGPGSFPLKMQRHYNSGHFGETTAFGPGWRGDFERSIAYDTSGTVPLATVYRPDGRAYTFPLSGGVFVGAPDVPDRLVRDPNGWRYITADDTTEYYDVGGRLLQIASRDGATLSLQYDGQGRVTAIVDALGRQLVFAYDSSGRTTGMTDPAGNLYAYQYDSLGRLASVTAPGNATRSYLYNEQSYTGNSDLPYAMTGIVDENATRFAIFRYDSSRRAVSTSHLAAPGVEVERYQLTYRQGGATVVDPLGTSRDFSFQTYFGAYKPAGVSQPCASCGSVSAATSYDQNSGWPVSKTDFNGTVTTYQRNDPYGRRDLETQRIEAAYTGQARTITTQWHATLRLPATITEPAPGGGNRTTSYVYDGMGNLLSKSVAAPKNDGTAATLTRSWSWTYLSRGRIATSTDPNGNVTTYTYYSDSDPDTGKRGNVASITSAVGHVQQFTAYDAAGRPLTTVDANGLVTTLQYDARGRLVSRTVGTERTDYSYDALGQVTAVMLPDGSSLIYIYDGAHRLVEIRDGIGDRIVYTLDAAGNRVREDSYDPAGTLTRTRRRAFDALNRLASDIGAQNQTTTYTYDNNGNLLSSTDALTHKVMNQFDTLHRLIQVTAPDGGVVRYSYDSASHLSQVQDARNLSTTYGYDGLGNATRVVSPDSGTATQSFDAAGNLLTRLDARGVLATYTYDKLGRATQVVFSKSGSPSETHRFEYDGGTAGAPNAKGRLTTVTDAAATTSWTYTARGRVSSKRQTTGALTQTALYGYNAAGQLQTLTTPSGQVVGYTYRNNRVQSVTVNGQQLIAQAGTEPFGPLAGWQWGNGLNEFRDYDADGRLASWEFRNGTSLLRRNVQYDAADRVVAIVDPANASNTGTYGYDAVGRLTSLTSSGLNASYSYDMAGNRTSATVNGAASISTFSAASNQLAALGNGPLSYLGGDALRTFTYNLANRLVAVGNGSGTLATYQVNALGQRVTKLAGGVATYFFYDEQGHVLGEYSAAGALIEETVWLEDLPVATLRPNDAGGISLYYVHADHLGSPRAVSRPGDNAFVWRWDNVDPFGATAANDNPAGLAVFAYNLRFPGQYYDAETGTHYNSHRDYDPSVGRYEQPDPIGLQGGINPYVYGRGAPTTYSDPTGLYVRVCSRPLAWFPGMLWRFRHNYIDLNGVDYGFYCKGGGLCPFRGPGEVRANVEQRPFMNCNDVDCIDERRLVVEISADMADPPNYNLFCSNCQDWAVQKLFDSLDPAKCTRCKLD